MSDANDDIIQMAGIGVTAGLALGTMNMINRAMDPRPKKRKRRCSR